MSELKLSYSGYVCAPYLHNRDSLELKESWTSSKNIEKLFFVTGTFSDESQPTVLHLINKSTDIFIIYIYLKKMF